MIYASSFSDDFSTLLTQLILERFSDPLSAAQVQIILPTRRACRTVQETFLKKAEKKALLLPKLVPLYDLTNLHADIPPICSDLKRTLLLTRLTQNKPNITNPATALQVAGELGTLLDEFYQYRVPTDALQNLVQNTQFARHWNQTIDFLDIIRTYWPKILSEAGEIDAMAATVRLIDGWAHALQENNAQTSTPSDPITSENDTCSSATFTLNRSDQHNSSILSSKKTAIFAGFDGSIPAVNNLIKALSLQDNTLILIDGFDFNMTEETAKNLPETHFLYSKVKLLKKLNFPLNAVRPIHTLLHSPKNQKNPQISAISEREQWILNAFMPESETARWHTLPPLSPQVIDNVHRLTAQTPAEEALAIALILRQVIETPEKTAALVTTDRTLARRVIAEMKRWHITLNDTAGVPLSHTDIGLYLITLLRFLIFSNATDALALFKNPLTCDGRPSGDLLSETQKEEVSARWEERVFQSPLHTDLSHFKDIFTTSTPCSFHDLLTAHLEVAETLASDDKTFGSNRLWCSDAGKAAYALLMELKENAGLVQNLKPIDYMTFLTVLFDKTAVRPSFGTHPRLTILGPIEARLHHPDVCIIGSLNEGIFPPVPETGPWVNRPMRAALGLPSPEAKITALTADFIHCLSAPTVWLTRSLKNEGAPSIPSRFLSRLETLIQANHIDWPIQRADLAQKLEEPTTYQKITRPAPCPPVTARPRQLSATRIELWMRNPYAIYARYILKLKPLPELENHQKNKQFGICIHKILEDFFTDYTDWTDLDALLKLGHQTIHHSDLKPAEKAFFIPQFDRMAGFIVAHQMIRQATTKRVYTERTGDFVLKRPGGDFTLFATADRIDILSDGTTEIIDYKTGSVPSAAEIKAGFSPQLPLEALILSEKGFKDITDIAPISKLSHWRLTGRGDGGVITDAIAQKSTDTAADLIIGARRGLEILIDTFDNADTPYEATPIPSKAPRYDDYEHLSRAKEWMSSEDTDDTE